MSHFLLVGGSHGIGRALVDLLVEKGNSVTVLSRTIGDLEGNEQVAHHSLDIAQANPDFPSIADPIDGIVYLPGSIQLRPFKGLSIDQFVKEWELNFLGAVKVIKHYLPKLDTGSIVLMSTVAVRQGMAYHASIGSAKGAVEGLTRSLAAELAPKVRVNAVAPSLTDTPLAEQLLNNDTKREHAAARHPLQRIGSPEDIAAAIAFLLSAESSWITGQVLHVDGGLSSLKMI